MKTILEKLQEDKRILQATCSGNKRCGQCKVKVSNKLIPICKEEEQLLTSIEIKSGIRLACCHEYQENMFIEELSSKMSILEDIYIEETVNYSEENGFGVIVDIGTTTVVMKWVDLHTGESVCTKSFQNPQASYGGDVVSRIQYDSQNKNVLHQIITETIERELISNKPFSIKRMVVCGNTTMTHLFLGLKVESLGHVPFTVPIKSSVLVKSDKIFKNVKEIFEIYTFPHASAFVGGDIISGIFVTGIYQSQENQMLLDLGTNGEIVIGNKERILTTSTAAGPAFEGYGITCGGPSIPGAISKVEIKDGNITYYTLQYKKANCICGSGLISLIAELRKNDIINELGRFTKDIKVFQLTDKIYLTEKDIQTFQLAKAAIQVGITVLLEEMKNVDTIYISGGFGSKVSVNDLITLNILPSQYAYKVKIVNNSALSGAYKLLLTKDYECIENIIAISSNINLAEYPNFDDLMIDGLYFNV